MNQVTLFLDVAGLLDVKLFIVSPFQNKTEREDKGAFSYVTKVEGFIKR